MSNCIDRRSLLKAGGVGALGLGAPTLANAAGSEQFNWKIVTTWPNRYPGLGTTVDWFAKEVKKASNGRLNISVYGAGELVPAFEVFNAVSDGVAEMGHGAAYYWKGKIPESEIFTSVPFGMTPLEVTAWLYEGGGNDLLNELYEPFGVIPFPCGNSDIQMGGWFNKEINSLADLQGLKIRIPGVAGEVYNLVGATTVSMPGGEIFTSMQSGVIDAADWVGPWNDQAFGLHKVAKYYYGTWQEPGSPCELMVNAMAYNQLPDDLKTIIEVTARAATLKMVIDFRANNAHSLQNLLENEGVQLRQFPDDVVQAFKEKSAEYMEQYAQKSEMAARVLQSYRAFQRAQMLLAENELRYLQRRRD